MRNRTRWLFPLIALLLLVPWPVAYATDFTGDMPGQELVRIEAADASLNPTWTVFRGVIGGVGTPSDLFYIDAGDSAADVNLTLYITNAQELSHHYRYMILKVGVYVENGSAGWERATTGSGQALSDIYITLSNARLSFSLPGYAKYRVAIDSGSFYCTNTSTDGDGLSPQFYLVTD